MTTKLLYTALVGLLASNGVSNATDRLSLTDGKQTGNQLTPYQGPNNSLTENVDFTNASQTIIKVSQQLSPTDFIQVEGVVRYLGQDLYGLPHFMEYLNSCVANYKPGMKLDAPKEIVISAEDTINIGHFSKYFCQNLLGKNFDGQTVTPDEFKGFKSSDDKAFDSYAYENNCIFFALTNYLAKSGAQPVEIKHTRNNYSNLRFIFSSCPSTDKEKGTQVNSSFKIDDVPYSSYGSNKIAQVPSPDTITNYLSSAGMCGNIYDAMYNITLFKVEEDTYRMNVKLSSKDSHTSSYGVSNEYKPRQISNILLQLKK